MGFSYNQGKGTKQKIDTMYAHNIQDTYKRFPAAKSIRLQIANSMRYARFDGHDCGALDMVQQKTMLFDQRMMNLYTPRLTVNRSESRMPGRCKTSPFIMHTKASMEKKGLDYNHFYSLKHSARVAHSWKNLHSNESSSKSSSPCLVSTDFTKGQMLHDISQSLKLDGSMRVLTRNDIYAMLPKRQKERICTST
jgi:hypothetical protein